MNTTLRSARPLLPALLFLASVPFLGASTWWVRAQLTDRQRSDGSESVTDESQQVCDTGQTHDYRDSSERHADNSSVTHEDESGNGSIESDGWHDDGGSWTHTHDTTIDRDGSRMDHDVYTKTDKNGNPETWETVTAHDPKGHKTFEQKIHDNKPRAKRHWPKKE